jgi:outer membrane immunogenic protein
MKKFLVTAAAFAALLGTPAFAADIALKAAPPPAPPPCVWCGWYIGLNAGWVGSTGNNFSNTGTDTGVGGLGFILAAGAIPGSVSTTTSGFIGGEQIGYNWQTANWLVGLEGDFDWVSARKTTTLAFPGSAVVVAPFTTTYGRQLEWLSTVRGRFGVLASPNFLLYVTGGVAIGGVKTSSSLVCNAVCVPVTSTESSTANSGTSTRVGETVGGGVEWMVAQHWSIKAEYLYVNLGRTNSTITYTYPPDTSTLTSSVRNSYNIARAGVNLHF